MRNAAGLVGRICDKKYIKVTYHEHRTGKCKGATHQICNIRYFDNRQLRLIYKRLDGNGDHSLINNAFEINPEFVSTNFNLSEFACTNYELVYW